MVSHLDLEEEAAAETGSLAQKLMLVSAISFLINIKLPQGL